MTLPGSTAIKPAILLLDRGDSLKKLASLLEPTYDLFTASAVEELITIAEMIRFDAVLVVFDDDPFDYATITEIRSMPCYEAVPIIACSEQRIQGVEEWIRMPFVKDEVFEALRRILG